MGQTILVRDVIHGKAFSEWPYRVVEDRGDELRVLLTPGTEGVSPALWVKSMRENDPAAREELLSAYARREWEMDTWVWQRFTRLRFMYSDRHFAIDVTWDADGEFAWWYVNFQLPFTRTETGVDTSDLHLDLIVQPDFSWQWKDEDEYQGAIDLGLVPDEWQKAIADARDQAVSMVTRRQGPFAKDWRRSLRESGSSGDDQCGEGRLP